MSSPGGHVRAIDEVSVVLEGGGGTGQEGVEVDAVAAELQH